MIAVEVRSFSFLKGYPVETSVHGGGFVFDCRCIKNPGQVDHLKPLTGRDGPVADYLLTETDMPAFLLEIQAILKRSITSYLKSGYDSLSVSFGCTGGQHRSLYAAEQTEKWLLQEFKDKVTVVKNHREFPE
ncbi:Nucleotide-binding protein YvcJ [Dyadobacter sp. CECT 9275]|uniref:Nucleotide-binding protein YvcJ n=1 Tax=Dyadobacter helix TaxID=2822344 RepID=A0A916JC16_9BACT|nr:RNase adapter RapZ [Dyadobacter sp. CECT 9275]CAG5002101.1 Nucleotide-binding protein YvcJ [Dyadobacter sp. CECT 9275]